MNLVLAMSLGSVSGHGHMNSVLDMRFRTVSVLDISLGNVYVLNMSLGTVSILDLSLGTLCALHKGCVSVFVLYISVLNVCFMAPKQSSKNTGD